MFFATEVVFVFKTQSMKPGYSFALLWPKHTKGPMAETYEIQTATINISNTADSHAAIGPFPKNKRAGWPKTHEFINEIDVLFQTNVAATY